MAITQVDLRQFDPGQFRHVVEIQEDLNQGTYDDYGGSTGNWQAISGSSKVRARITTLSGLELIRARQLVHEATHEVECNYRKGVTTAHRLRWVDVESSTHYLYIRHINNPEQNNLSLVLTVNEEPL